MSLQISILGAGAGGLAAAADLSIIGHDVTLYELPEFEENLDAIQANDGIRLIGAANEGHVMPNQMTTDGETAVEDADLILQVVPNFAFDRFAAEVGPYLKPGQPFVLLSANTLSAFEYRRLLNELDVPEIALGETPSLAYAVRKVSPTTVNVLGTKDKLTVAGLPPKHTDRLSDRLNEAFPLDVVPAENVLETSLYNANPVIHPVGTLLNLGAIDEADGGYSMYRNVSESIGYMMAAVDEERIAIGEKLGFSVSTIGELFYDWYQIGKNRYYATTAESIRESPVHEQVDGPDSPDHRYLTEDIPYGLVPLSSLGDAVGVETPVIDSFITMAENLHGVDYRQTGRTLETCGITPATRTELLNAAGTQPVNQTTARTNPESE